MRKKETEKSKFSKEQLAASNRYKGQKDLVRVMLERGRGYSVEETEEALNQFRKGKVR